MSEVKATVTFNLDDKEQERKFKRWAAADDLCAVISEFDTYLHNHAKHNGDEAAERYREKLHELLDDLVPHFDYLWQ